MLMRSDWRLTTILSISTVKINIRARVVTVEGPRGMS